MLGQNGSDPRVGCVNFDSEFQIGVRMVEDGSGGETIFELKESVLS